MFINKELSKDSITGKALISIMGNQHSRKHNGMADDHRKIQAHCPSMQR